MLKIGFVDYYLDEWHANNYPEIFKRLSNGRYEVCCAYGKIDSPIGGMTNEEWSKQTGVPLVDSIEEVIEKSDRLIVLSPDNPEMHEELADLVLKSGKLTYVDKAFAPTPEAAIRMFEKADKYGTKCYSSSALRFTTELKDFDVSKIDAIYSEGPGMFFNYAIHQIEPIVTLMQARAKRVMYTGTENHPSLAIEFADGRIAQMYHRTNEEFNFKITVVDKENNSVSRVLGSNYFELFIASVIEFFDTGVIPVPHEQTIDVMGILCAANKAKLTPFTWVNL